MRSPTLEELPSPPPGKSGWPWTEESAQLPATMPNGAPWPRVSVLTPSYNQGSFIEEMIRSVLLQGYPDLELIVVDGGSSDGTVAILQKYAPWLGYWVSEPDAGQSDALNKGLAVASGEILGWLNTDESYAQGALVRFTEAFTTHPDWAVVFGNAAYIDENGRVGKVARYYYSRERLLRFWEYGEYVGVGSSATFYRRHVFDTVGAFDTQLHYVMDLDFFWRAARWYEFHHLEGVAARFHIHPDAKSSRGHEPFWREKWLVAKRVGMQESQSRLARARHPLQRGYWRAVAMDLLNDAPSARRFRAHHLLYGIWLNPGLLRHQSFWKKLVRRAVGPQRAHRL